MTIVYQAGRGWETLQNPLVSPAFTGMPRRSNLWHTTIALAGMNMPRTPVASPRPTSGTPKTLKRKLSR
jgi:hypothetical protein